MEHALVKIADNAPAVVAQTPTALIVGKINYGADLYKVYVADESKESTQIQLLVKLATVTQLTVQEFTDACKQAQEAADAEDKANGFSPAADAKGTEKYGPKRRVMNQRLSEAKQIFGALKLQPDICKEKGYWTSLDTCRNYLADIGLKWDGSKALDSTERKLKREQKQLKSAIVDTMSELAQKPGEDIGEYMARVQEHAKNRAFEDQVNKLVDSFIKDNGSGDVSLTVAMRVFERIASPDQMHNFAQYLHETALAAGEAPM